MYETNREESAVAVSVAETILRALRRVRGLPIEALVWTAGLAAMAAMDPHGTHLFSLCPLDAMGVSFCPGCGLGHSVAFLVRGELSASVQAHPLGLPAVLILIVHVGRLVRAPDPVDSCLYAS